MTAASILQLGFVITAQQVKFVILDCLWRFLWAILSAFTVLMFGAGVMAQMGSIVSEGPDLGAVNSIILFAALRQFWNEYGMILLAGSGFMLLAIMSLWLILEALFRGGFKGFWIYLGTGAARVAILIGTATMFLVLATKDQDGGSLFIGAVVMLGMWYMTGLMETVVRRDAVDLLATDFLTLSTVMGSLRLIEGILAFLILGSAGTALLRVSDPTLSAAWFALVVLFWLVLQSYLAAVRYSAIDIMRRNVVRG